MALFVGVWFVAVSAGPEVTHACPTHGIHSAAAGRHASHGASQAVGAHHGTSGTESTPPRGSQCTCLGQCCSVPPVAVISASISLADIGTVATVDAGLPDYAYVPVYTRHVLPLAHAPPLSA